jgi:hypothetical protein
MGWLPILIVVSEAGSCWKISVGETYNTPALALAKGTISADLDWSCIKVFLRPLRIGAPGAWGHMADGVAIARGRRLAVFFFIPNLAGGGY